MPAPPSARRRTLPSATAAALVAVLALAGCGTTAQGEQGPGSGALEVVATTTVLQDFVRQVGGDRVDVTGLLRPGVDAHDFEASPADLAALAEADLLVQNGVGLEDWLDDAVTSSGYDGPVVDASEGIELRHGHSDDHAEDADGQADHAEGDADPHVWASPRNALTMVDNVEAGLVAADPAGEEAYRAAAEDYRAELRALDARTEQALAGLTDRRIVTSHDAFGYYADRYGLDVVTAVIPSFDSSAELSASQVSDVVARIRESGATAVFSEAQLPPRTAEVVAREAGVQVVAGEDALFGDGLGGPGTGAETYVDMIDHNTRVIVQALGG